MNIVCLKWGDRFSHEHVNRLYRMVCKNFKHDFNFICHTENADNIDDNIIIQPLPDYGLEKWWSKLTLFEHPADVPNIFFDLDVVIQNDITHFKDYFIKDKLCLVKSYWKPYQLKQFDTNINSSIMLWYGDNTGLWKEFDSNIDYYMLKYNGIDGYLDHHQSEKLFYLPEGDVYSRLYGIDKNNYWRAGDDLDPKYFYEPNYNVCIFNGWQRKIIKQTGRYALDDEGYDGFKHYWD